ncbi:hypothetical protein IFO70_00235 [Phormidium tenue FACHB-886]|nr:hypothetical protein [Phormidium tenue FACHB-886]
MGDRSNFINPYSRYHGDFTPENLIFNANLQEFSHRVSIICGLETSGKLTPEESFEQIQALWRQLKQSGEALS